MRTRIAEAYNTTTVQRNAHLFAACNDQFLSRLMLSLGETFLMPGELVLKRGDIARELTFVKKGVLLVTDVKGTLVELISGEGASLCLLSLLLFVASSVTSRGAAGAARQQSSMCAGWPAIYAPDCGHSQGMTDTCSRAA